MHPVIGSHAAGSSSRWSSLILIPRNFPFSPIGVAYGPERVVWYPFGRSGQS